MWSMTWDQVNAACIDLTRNILGSGFKPSTIVAIAKGGIIPAGIVHQFFPRAHIIVLRVSSYFNGEQVNPPVIHNPEVLTFCDPDTTLFIDDICDSGATFQCLHEGIGLGMKFGAMLLRQDFRDPELCDFVGHIAPHGWVNFPWEENIAVIDKARATLGG